MMVDLHLYVARSHAEVGRRKFQTHIDEVLGVVVLVPFHLPEVQEILEEGFEELFLHGLELAERRLLPLYPLAYIAVGGAVSEIVAGGRHLRDEIAELRHGGRVLYHPLCLSKEQKHFPVSLQVDF